MSKYKLVTIDQTFIAETIARTGSEQLLEKASRNYVGLYNEEESWYIPLRANIGNKKPENSYFETKFETDNPHFKRPGLDFQKSLYIPKDKVIEIRNTLPKKQAEIIENNQNKIQEKFENYVISIGNLDINDNNYKFSTVKLFPEGIERIKELQKEREKEIYEIKEYIDENLSYLDRYSFEEDDDFLDSIQQDDDLEYIKKL